MDIQPSFNGYRAVAHMCQYFSKTEDQFSQAMKQAAKKAFEDNMYHLGMMKTIAKVYLSSRECSASKAVSHVLPELMLSRVFPAVYFVNINLPEKIVQVLLPAKKLSELPHNRPNIFKTLTIDRYLERPNATFCKRKYIVLNHFCYVDILAYYTLENKSNKACKYEPGELDDKPIENSYGESCPKIIKLMILGKTMQRRKVTRIL